MSFVIENLRLRDLVTIVKQNQQFYAEFVKFLTGKGYKDIHDFINDKDDLRAIFVLEDYLTSRPKSKFYDGLGRPYPDVTAKWYFLAWILRDAPVQRLAPLLRTIEGDSLDKKKAFLLNQLRKFVGPLFPEAKKWEWPVLSEVMIARLEGSRRALKGIKFEDLVRVLLRKLFVAHNLPLVVGDKEKRINEETYDVQIFIGSKTILIPVKTRETMGGGHANLFTRDIFKSITVAQENGFECIPIIIAESWAGNLESLKCKHFVYIQANPNQTEEVEKMLQKALTDLLTVWRNFVTKEK